MTRRTIPLLVAFGAAALVAGCKPRVPDDALGEVHAVSGGADMTCAYRRDGSTWCWGDDALTGDILARKYATKALPERIRAASSDGAQTCVVFDDATLGCTEASFGRASPLWPAAWTERTTSSYRRPRSLLRVPLVTDVAQIGVGTYLDCARGARGAVWCWGDYAEVLRTGAYDMHRPSIAKDPHASEVAAVRGLPPIVDLSVGDSVALAIGQDGSAWTVGGLARGVTRVPGIDDAAQAASGGEFHCVRRKSGAVSCWRDGFAIEELAKMPLTPTAVEGVPPMKTIAAGRYDACGVDQGGKVWCWGKRMYAGHTGHAIEWQKAERVADAERATSLVVGMTHGCALRDDGYVFCWGRAAMLGAGIEDEFDPKWRGKSAYARTGAADDPASTTKRAAGVVIGATLLGLLLALALAAATQRRATNAWRLLPGPPAVAGAGYRAGALHSTRAGAPGAVLAALWLGLASVGADVAYVAMFGLYSIVAGELGLRQLSRNPLSGAINLATAALVLVVVAWLALVAATIVSAAKASKRALGRLFVLAPLGAIGHLLLGLFAFGGRREIGWILDRHSMGAVASDTATLPILAALELASIAGVAASVVMLLAAMHRKALA